MPWLPVYAMLSSECLPMWTAGTPRSSKLCHKQWKDTYCRHNLHIEALRLGCPAPRIWPMERQWQQRRAETFNTWYTCWTVFWHLLTSTFKFTCELEQSKCIIGVYYSMIEMQGITKRHWTHLIGYVWSAICPAVYCDMQELQNRCRHPPMT